MSASRQLSALSRCRPARRIASAASRHYSQARPANSLTLNNITYPTDSHTNIPANLPAYLAQGGLHLKPSHPLSTTRQTIESLFPASQYEVYNSLPPVVTVAENFDSLCFPADHPGRSRSDTYYVNRDTVLRTHTSAHQAEKFRAMSGTQKPGYLISADVYRRDAIDRSHYPVFHQMEGARVFPRGGAASGNYGDSGVAAEIMREVEAMEVPNLQVVESCALHEEPVNPVQLAEQHTPEQAEAVAKHLQRQLELVVSRVFGEAAAATGAGAAQEKLQVRWISGYFPFTSPSYELEVFWNNEWLEVLGCGVIRQDLLNRAGQGDKIGWAFGLGLERIAMLMYGIPDIRLFWSQDERFARQFRDGVVRRFEPFSRHPACYKDVTFWVPAAAATTAGEEFHENDFMEVLRGTGGDLVEDVKLIDKFIHPTTGRTSLCYRITYRSLERTLTNPEVDSLQDSFRAALQNKLGLELR
ncbi:hypothetical protein DRE_03172 [Drechslerella stenobrocha 248]|uniref:Phenylalanine--tRNA ligase, mitochondrial n=1 Tax=Drechslerella stenobrocha 248 TaxID=1043628 RepID=W7I554_9PEZI|nr:hypothetical protein DRE_03172 [Drechslerella stenobrocha 248]